MRQTLDFLLDDWLKVQQLTERERFADHSAETFAAVLDTCEKIAREKFAPVNRLLDTEEPRFDGERVHLPAATHHAVAAYVESGMLAASRSLPLMWFPPSSARAAPSTVLVDKPSIRKLLHKIQYYAQLI